MNPQPEPYVGHLLALVFGFMFLYFAFKSYHSHNTSKPSDLFTIGYIEESTNVPEQQEQKKVSAEDNPIYADCVDALKALGMKKTDAIKQAKDIFTNFDNPPRSVQDFLMIALRTKK
jgi:hypothetical protein